MDYLQSSGRMGFVKKGDEYMVYMNMDILNVICAVLDHKRFIISNNMINPKYDFSWYEENRKYYFSLDLPDGLSKNISDYERILAMEGWFRNLWCDMEEQKLEKQVWKK